LPQNETLATPHAQLIYMNKFLCILDSTLKQIEEIINRKTAKINVKTILMLTSTDDRSSYITNSRTGTCKSHYSSGALAENLIHNRGLGDTSR